MSNTITAYFKGRVGVAESVYQNDYGIVMAFDSIDLPAHFDCYFSRLNQEEALPGVGADNMVAIPNSILANPGNVTIHIPLHTGESDSEVEYVIYFKVIGRARPIDDGTPAQMTAIAQALALLQNPITNIEQIVNEALSFTGTTLAELEAEDSAIKGRVTTLETDNTSNKSRLTTAEGDISGLDAQLATAISALTVDSEVQNIRVGDDAKTYASAGIAVRKQFEDIKTGLMVYIPNWVTGGIASDGTDDDTMTSNKRTDFIAVETFDGVPIVNTNPTYSGYLYEYSNNNVGAFVKYTQIKNATTLVFAPHKNTKYVRLSWFPNMGDHLTFYTNTPFLALIKNNTDRIGKTEYKTNLIKFSSNLLDRHGNRQINAYIKSNGEVASSNGWVAFTDFIPVEPNTIYSAVYWNGSAWSKDTSGYYAFYDSNKNVTHGAVVSSAYPAEAGANDAYMRISFANAIANKYPMICKLSYINNLPNSLSAYVDGGFVELEGDKALKVLGSAIDREVLLPSECYAVVGTEFNIYYENVFSVDNPENYFFAAFVSTGIAYNLYSDRMSFTPTDSMIGDHSVEVYAVRKNQKAYRNRVVSKTITLHVVANSALSNKKVLFIGDSLTNAGYYPYEIQEVLSNDGVESLGTMVSHPWVDGIQRTINHEGRGGWSAYDYTDLASKDGVANAFWNSNADEFDFSYYMTQQGYSRPDIVFLNLGTNGVDQTEKIITAIKEMITSIHAYDATIPILVSLIPPPATQDGWTYSLKNGTTATEFEINQRKLNSRYIEEFDGVLSNVYVSPVYFNLDRYNDYDSSEFALSARNPKIVVRQINNVHPSRYGYLKFADVYWAMIQALLSE